MLLELLSKFKKPILSIAAAGLLCALCFFWGAKSVKPKIVERVQLQEKIVEKIVEVEVSKKNEKTKKVVKIIEHPDGSKETTITEETESEEESSSTKDKTASEEKSKRTDPIAIFPKTKTKFSLGLTVETALSRQIFEGPELRYGVEAGFRILHLPVWITTSYQFKTKDISAGFRYEF